MRRKEDQLFVLIKSLSSSEKSYFKKFVSGNEGKERSQHIVLFDVINNLKEYDEKLLKAKISRQPFARHLSVTKNYLFHLILKCLNTYYSAHTKERQVQELIWNADILLKKGLYQYAGKLLDKAKQFAGSQHYDLTKIAILKQLARYYFMQDDPDSVEIFTNQFEKEAIHYLELEIELIRCTVLQSRAAIYSKRKGFMQGRLKFKPAFEKEARELEQCELSFYAKYNLYAACATYYQIRGDYFSSYQYACKSVWLLESDEQVIWEKPDLYVVALHALMICLILLKRYDEFWKASRKLRNLQVKYASACSEITRQTIFRSYHLDLHVYCTTGKFSEGIESAKDIHSELNRFGNRLGKNFQMDFYYNLACLYFGGGSYRNALQWLNLLMNDKSLKGTRVDIHKPARILNLMIHIELGNIHTLPYTVRAARRYFSKYGKLFRIENTVLSYFNKYHKNNNKAELKVWYVNLKNELLLVKNNPAEKGILAETYLIPWLESKIENRDFAEIVREKVLQK